MFIVLGASIPDSYAYPVIFDALTQWTWVPPVGLLGIYMILLFPDGRLPSRRWRPFAWFAGAIMVLASVAVTISPGPLPDHPGVSNPLGLEVHSMVAQALLGGPVLLPICILVSAFSLVWRYRHSGGEVRLQIKWVAFAASLVGITYAVTLVSGLFLTPETSTNGQGASLWLALLQNAVLMSYAGVPIAVGFAVLRYRLYEIDILINRTLVYGSLTVLLASAYVGGVVGLQAILRGLSGQESTLAVVASTLAIAALFNPLRRRVQAFVDRRFYRKKYDARKTLEAFSGRLRDETDLNTLSGDLVTVVRETMQPAHVSLWVRQGPQDEPWKCRGGSPLHFHGSSGEFVVVLVALGMEVRLDELDGGVACDECDTTHFQHGNPGGNLEQGGHVRCRGSGPDPLPGVFDLTSCSLFEEPAQGDGPVISVL
jgi:hypothetical protein